MEIENNLLIGELKAFFYQCIPLFQKDHRFFRLTLVSRNGKSGEKKQRDVPIGRMTEFKVGEGLYFTDDAAPMKNLVMIPYSAIESIQISFNSGGRKAARRVRIIADISECNIGQIKKP